MTAHLYDMHSLTFPSQANSITELFTVTTHRYRVGDVSWTDADGRYYIQRMDREGYARRIAKLENSRGGSARATRSRR